jgi:hypothetical protein
MDIWFSIIGGTVLKMILPGTILVGGYIYACKRFDRNVNPRIVYYILSFLFLVSVFASIGELWESQSFVK